MTRQTVHIVHVGFHNVSCVELMINTERIGILIGLWKKNYFYLFIEPVQVQWGGFRFGLPIIMWLRDLCNNNIDIFWGTHKIIWCATSPPYETWTIYWITRQQPAWFWTKYINWCLLFQIANKWVLLSQIDKKINDKI